MKAVRFVCLAAAATLSACSLIPASTPAQLYALGPLSVTSNAPVCRFSFALREVDLPGLLDRPEVTLAVNQAQVQASASHLWASPLKPELTRLFGQGLANSLQGAQLAPYPLRQGQLPQVLIVVQINELYRVGENMRLVWQWQAWRAAGSEANRAANNLSGRLEALLAKGQVNVQITMPANATVSAHVLGMQQALQQGFVQWGSQILLDPGTKGWCQP
jgi:uncharacterized lipoprotein YmbA